MSFDKQIYRAIMNAQRNEITSNIIYNRLARTTKDAHNSEILRSIAEEEKKHYEFLKTITKRDVRSSKIKIWFFYFISKVFGLTFGVRLMERGEGAAQALYQKIANNIPEASQILKDEEKHEDQLIDMLNEELLNYVGSIVLGLSDALVELTGALAGFTFALQNTSLIVLTGFITGIAAAFSMGASEYLSASEEEAKNPLKAALYTGMTYLVTVIILILPFLIFGAYGALVGLGVALINAVVVIFVFTFYISVAKNYSFKKRFLKITGISLGVAFISLIIGIIVRIVFNIEV